MAEDILDELGDWIAGLTRGDPTVAIDGIMRTLVGEGLPVQGQRKQGLLVEAYGGPIVGYLVIIGYFLFGFNPIAGTVVIAVLNVIGVLLVYLVGRHLYDHQVGLISAIFIATSPWFVLYSRKIWTSVNFPWVIPLLLLALWSCAKQGRSYAYFTAGLSLGIAAQLHLTSFALVPPALIFLVLYGTNFDIRNVILLCVGGFIGHLPLIIFDLEENWLNFRIYTKLAIDPGSVRPLYNDGPPKHREEVFKKLWQLTVGSGLTSKLGSGFHYGNYDLLLDIILMLILVLSFISIGWMTLSGFTSNMRREKKRHKTSVTYHKSSWRIVSTFFLAGILLALAYFIVRVDINGEIHQVRLFLLLSSLSFVITLVSIPLSRAIFSKTLYYVRSRLTFAPANDFLLFTTFGFMIWYNLYGFTGKAAGVIHIHYLNVLFPLPFLIISRGLQLAATHLSKPEFGSVSLTRAIPWILLLLVVIQNLVIINRAFEFIDETGGEGEYGTTFESKLEAVQFVMDDSGNNFRVRASYVRDFDAYDYIFHSLIQDEIHSNYPYIYGGSNDQARVSYALIEPNNHWSAFESYNSSILHPLLGRFQGVYVFLD